MTVHIPRALERAGEEYDRALAKVSSIRQQVPEAAEEPPLDILTSSAPPVMDISHLPTLIADAALERSEMIGSDPGIGALTMLAACAGAIDDAIRIQPLRHDDDWKESARLWVAIVGDPASRKSPPMARAVGPLKAAQARSYEAFQLEMARYIEDIEAWKDEKKAAKSTGIPLPKAPEKPVWKRYYMTDATAESASIILSENPQGITSYHDELSGWFGKMDAYHSTVGGDTAFWLQAYEGGTFTRDRVGSGHTHVPNLSISLIGGIQPESISKIASKLVEDGLLQRFLVYCAAPSVDGIDRRKDRKILSRYSDVVRSLTELKAPESMVTLSEEAHIVRCELTARVRVLLSASRGKIRAWLGKAEGFFARLVLVYHCIECADLGIYPTCKPVSGENAERVSRLFFSTLYQHARYFYGEILNQHEHAGHLTSVALLILAREPESINRRWMARNYRPAAKNWDQISQVLDSLAAYGWLVRVGIDKRGKTTSWTPRRAIYELFADQASAERKRREKARKILENK